MEHQAAIELKAICCRDLALPIALFGNPPMYAVVSLLDGTGRAGVLRSQSTNFDRKGGRNPEWDQQLRFDLPSPDMGYPLCPIVLEFEFVSRRGVAGVLGDPVVGTATVFLRDLLQEYAAAFVVGTGGRFRSASFQVQSPGGKPGGEVTFLYRIRPQRGRMESPPPGPDLSVNPSATCYPAPAVSFADQVEADAVQQPGAMYRYCCPASVPLPPSDSSGYPAVDYDFPSCGIVPSSAAPPPPPAYATVPPPRPPGTRGEWMAELVGRPYRTERWLR